MKYNELISAMPAKAGIYFLRESSTFVVMANKYIDYYWITKDIELKL